MGCCMSRYLRGSVVNVVARLVVALCAVVAFVWWAEPAGAFEPWWVQAHQETQLWSGPDVGAVSLGRVSQWGYLQVVSPQTGKRLFVLNPQTKNYAYVDAAAVGPSAPPPSPAASSAATTAVAVSDGKTAAVAGMAPFEPWWVQNHRETQLWSGPDVGAASFGQVGQWGYFQVVVPQQGSRLYVFNPVSRNYAYIDAGAVGPSGPSPLVPRPLLVAASGDALRKAPSPAVDYQPWWVGNFRETELWAGPDKDAKSLGKVPQFRRFMVVEPQKGDRLRVWSPEKDQYGYLDAAVVGPSGPSVWLQARAPKLLGELDLPGRAVSVPEKAYVRNLPVYDEETELRPVANNTPLQVRQSVMAADGTEWYTVGEGQYIRAGDVRIPKPITTVGLRSGRWIDADLGEPTMIAAYEGEKIVRTMLAIRGIDGAPTTVGSFKIVRRVDNETMDSETIGIPRDSPKGYLLEDVLYTQYFTNDGAALHYNWWLGNFGFPGSHGCLGVSLEDARWLWQWAQVGTPVVVRDSSGDGALMAAESLAAESEH